MRKFVFWGVIALVVLGIIGATHNGSKDSSSDSSAAVAAADISAPTVSGKIRGSFSHACFLCSDNMQSYIDVSNVWCAWVDDDVVVHVTMTNGSAEHVTVDWHPSYSIEGGASHGTGLSSIQSDGFDSGETRDLEAHQSPQGVSSGTPLSECKPSFNQVESG